MSEKDFDFLSGRMYVTGNHGYQKILVFDPNFTSLILVSN